MAIQLDPKKDRALIKQLTDNTAARGTQAAPAAKTPAKNSGTGSRTGALDTLAAQGWTLVGWDYLHDMWFALRYLTERRESATYDELLDTLLDEVKHGYV